MDPSRFNIRSLFGLPKDYKAPTSIFQSEARQVIRNAETARLRAAISSWARKSPKLSAFLLGVGGVSFLLATSKSISIGKANEEIAFRKSQIVQPVYELKGEEAVNVPWNKDNLNQWLYRPVRITGRPIHNKAMLIPRTVDGYAGFDYILPLVTKENEDGSVQEGVLLNKGWMPHEYAHPGARWRIENALPQTFDCYVSLNSELDEKNEFFKKGNAVGSKFNVWSHVYLPDMAKASGLKNADTVKIALLERVNHKTALDERDPKHFEVNLIGSEDYPFEKTRAGALQLRHMPWELRAQRDGFFTLGFLSTALAIALRTIV